MICFVLSSMEDPQFFCDYCHEQCYVDQCRDPEFMGAWNPEDFDHPDGPELADGAHIVTDTMLPMELLRRAAIVTFVDRNGAETSEEMDDRCSPAVSFRIAEALETPDIDFGEEE